jgi:hypothetical protein
MTEARPLGLTKGRIGRPVDLTEPHRSVVNTRTALWPTRWPAIALQECIDIVEAAPLEVQSKVKYDLPCAQCPKNTACLNAKRKELGPLLYDREILTSPRTSESSLFPFDLFEPLLDRERECVPWYLKPFHDEQRYAVCSAWDLAWSEKIGGDWLVKMTGVLDRQTGLKIIIDVGRWQRLTFDEQVTLISGENARYRDDVVVIESDAAQKVWSQHMARNTSVPVLPHSASNKTDLATGVPKLLIELEQKRWSFPWTIGSFHYENVKIFLAEAEAFGWVDGKLEGVGEHDDTVMAWYHLSWGLDRLAVMEQTSFRRGVQRGAYI